MSGDVQPRKRKDKKKRKEEGDGFSSLSSNDDVNIHVHKEGGTGGNICAKIVFFFLFSALIVLIGLIIKENQGLNELETIESESRFSQIFEVSHEQEDHEEVEDDGYESEEQQLDETEEEQENDSQEEPSEDEEDDESVEETEENYTTEEDNGGESEEQNETPDNDSDNSEEKKESEEKTVVSEEEVEEEKKDESEETPQNASEIKEEITQEDLKQGSNEEPAKESSGNVEVNEEVESGSDKEEYENSNLSNKDDYEIRANIDEAEEYLNRNAAYANKLFEALLEKHALSPRALFGKGKALDVLAERKKSNELLTQALNYYLKALNAPDIPDPLFIMVGERYIERARFLGHYKKAVAVHWKLIERFPDNPKFLNNLAVTYLTVNLVEEARAVLKKVLAGWPNNGFALVHYGFILKTTDNNLEESIELMKKGIETRAPGVVDGRFYFHLGDALSRLSRQEEAMQVYEDGVNAKLFMSKYQRSLYNMPMLTAKPWWQLDDLPFYQKLFEALKMNWSTIRKEGIAVLNDKGFFEDEAENLRDTGTWKQLELFARGHKFAKNCARTPVTCSIIQSFPEASSCKRGQSKFSVMHPGTHVWPHCGPTNCRLRVHLGLKVPPQTFIRVAEETRSWKEGDLIIFDDSFEHEVWHNGTDFRLVLIVDVWHPDLSFSERQNLSPI